jgi:hypothetical protein
MNLKTIINLCVIFMCLTLCSCSQDEEVYSCDPKVDAWVKENLADIQKMSREDWLKLDENVNRAAFVAFTPNQKQLFWQEKMNEVLSLDWSDAEKNHLQKLYAMIANNPQWFADDSLEDERECERFDILTFEWRNYAEEELGWTKYQIGSIVASGNRLTNKSGILELHKTPFLRMMPLSMESKCDCNKIDDWCGSWDRGSECGTGLYCDYKATGCGWWFRQPCNGECGM